MIAYILLGIRFIRDMLFHNVRYALSRVSGPVENYLLGLLYIFLVGVLVPFPLAAIGVWQGWLTFVGLLGVWSFVFMVFLWIAGMPLGIAIDSLLSGPLTVPSLWRRYRAGKLVTAEGYLSYGRTVLLYETFSLFFLSQVPMNHNIRVTCGFTLAIFFLVFSGYEWRGKFGYWAKPLIRVVVLLVVICQFFYFLKTAFLPKVEPVAFVLLPAMGSTNVVTSLSDVDNPVITATVKGWWEWLETHYTSPALWFVIGLVVAFVLFTVWLIKKLAREGREAAAEAGDHAAKTAVDHHPKTTAGTDPHAKTRVSFGSVLAVVVAIAFLAIIGTGIQGCHTEHVAEVKEHLARLRLLDEQAATEREKRLAHPRPAPVQMAATTPASNGNGGAVWKGLKNPAKKTFQYTTDWGPVIQKPSDANVASDPPGLRPEIMINGDTNHILRPDGLTEWPPETRFFRVRNPRDETKIYVTFGVGPKATRP